MNSRSSLNVNTNDPTMRFKIRNGTPTAEPGKPSRREIVDDESHPVDRSLSDSELRVVACSIEADDRLFHHQVAGVVDEEQRAAIRTDPGRAIGQHGMDDLRSRGDRGDSSADLLQRVECRTAARLPIEEECAVQCSTESTGEFFDELDLGWFEWRLPFAANEL